ncbi:MAG: DEAD/DEAH box helicase [Chloroflexi bacterium]|nr:DEAD/DEAH box helicase [Chloroflexota bacterium]MCL5275368.1 DEAD/DEAH box helicase [Chloroflexota bacterium]
MSVLETLTALRADAEFMTNVTAWERAPAQPARHAPFPAQLHPAVVEALKRRGIASLYTHQAQAVEAALNRRNVVVVASAAGGKSLCFHLPIAHALLSNPTARALCLFPTKALSQDQYAHLSGLIADANNGDESNVKRQTSISNPQSLISNCQSPIPNLQSLISIYDGDTPQSRRADIRRDARVVISNADMLHIGILPHHTRWAAFFKNLRYVVIDELHAYRGIFGSHLANVIRRLKRLCAFYGSDPIFILASATIANPREHAERLIEAPVVLVDDDGSPHGERHVLVVNPPMVDADLGIRRSSVFVARDIAARFVEDGAQTICFARSRQDTEVLLTYLRNQTSNAKYQTSIEHPGKTPKRQAPRPSSPIVGYRGGYLPEERRAIEADLRSGAARCVVATNALELGIDIGELDACVMLGYPGSIASFWQQAGRAGRRRNASVAVMVTSATALDQYLAAHPEYLFRQTPEHARIAPDNLGVLAAHVACATFELPFERGEPLGRANVDDMLDVLVEEGEVHASDASAMPLFHTGVALNLQSQISNRRTRYTWVGDSYPADRVSLRGIGERVIVVTPRGDGDVDQLIGETERSTAPGRVHPGAIYMHQAEMYQITHLDWEQGRATAQRIDADYYTEPSVHSEVIVLREFDEERGRGERGCRGAGAADQAPTVKVACGELEVTTQARRYRQVQFNTHRTLAWSEIDLPAQHLYTTGYWFAIPEEITQQLAREGVLKLPNDYGPNWQRQRDAARARDRYTCTVCGAPEPPDRQHDVHHKKPFRDFKYIRGENDHYLAANELNNLVTVCPNCHRDIETAEATRTALEGLAYLAGNLAPLFVMCDPGDLSAVSDIQSAHTRLPTITVYEQTPGGTGLSDELYAHHKELLRMAAQRIRECPCERGCPACVGPIDEAVQSRDLKADTLRLIGMLSPR